MRKTMPVFALRFSYHGTYDNLSFPITYWYASAALVLFALALSIYRKKEAVPFLLNILLFVFLGVFVIAHLWPFVIPPGLSLYDTGSPAYGNTILLYAAIIVIPVILCYLSYSYLVFKGKTTGKDNYEPILANDEHALHHKGRKPVEKTEKVILLKWPVRILLSISWLALFFIVLGFLGDATALGIIFILNSTFLFFWYKNSRQSDYSEKP